MTIKCLASKVRCLVGFGFAAGCEAVATPRRRRASYSVGYAPGAAFGLIDRGQSPNQGHSPEVDLVAVGGA
jgi:hypothetical protein